MPIYRMDGKRDGKQKYRVRINYTREGESKQIDRVIYGWDEAKELEINLIRDLREETVKKITLRQLYNDYIDAKQYEVRESTLDKSKSILNTYILPFLGDYKINKLTKVTLKNWKTYIEQQKTSKGNKFSLKWKKNIFGELRALLNYAVKMDYMFKNPLTSLGNFKDPNAIKKKIDYYTAEEFLKFIKICRQEAIQSEKENNCINEWNYYVFFNIAFYTGLRKGEIYALKWTDIESTILHISRSIAQKLKGGDRETPPKNESSIRDLKIPTPLLEVLKEHYQRYQKIDGFTDNWRICGGELCIRDSTLERKNKLYAEKAGLKKIRIHDFRHSHASLLANERINIQEIARRLGHSQIEITWNIYSHLYPREEERAIDVLNKIV